MTSPSLDVLEVTRLDALARLRPPPRLPLSIWTEKVLRLPEGVSHNHGRVELWPFQKGIADAITDPLIERVTLVKPVRVGFTTLLTAAIGSWVANEPSPILALLPTEDDCRDYMVSDIEPIFEATPELRGALMGEFDERGRNTLLARRFPGGFLKIVAAKSPRNLRRHTVKVLLIDEADGMEASREGSPIILAERRTMSYPDRKIVVGSTPTDEETSLVLRSYRASDQRVFEVPCPDCGTMSEMLWSHIKWERGRSHTAMWECPACRSLIDERHKHAMVRDGEWRATKPEANEGKERIHAGFRLNALVSPLPNASWKQLAAEWEVAQGNPETEQPFVNTIEGRGWRGPGADIDTAMLAAGARQDIGLTGRNEDGSWKFPSQVVLLVAGVDVQKDRVEVSIVGYATGETEGPVDPKAKRRAEQWYVLGHFVIHGNPEDETTFLELDETLRTRWDHPCGAKIGISAAVVDSGNWTDEVYAYCKPRHMRRVLAGKGMPGFKRPLVQKSRNPKLHPVPLHIIAVDVIKNRLWFRLTDPRATFFSADVVEDNPDYFDQLGGEKRVLSYIGGQPKVSFERKGTMRVESLDCLVYATAARNTLAANLDLYAQRLAQTSQAAAKPAAAGGGLGAISERLHGR